MDVAGAPISFCVHVVPFVEYAKFPAAPLAAQLPPKYAIFLMSLAPNDDVLVDHEIDAGSVLIVENIAPPLPATTSVVPSVAATESVAAVEIPVLFVHVVPSVEVATAPLFPTATQADIGANQRTILGVVTVTDVLVSPELTQVRMEFPPEFASKNLPFSYVSWLFPSVLVVNVLDILEYVLFGNGDAVRIVPAARSPQ